MTYTIEEINAAKLNLLREDIADRFAKAIAALYELSVRTEDDENAARLTDKYLALEDVSSMYMSMLTSETLTIQDVWNILDEFEDSGTSEGGLQGYSLAVDYITSYLR